MSSTPIPDHTTEDTVTASHSSETFPATGPLLPESIQESDDRSESVRSPSGPTPVSNGWLEIPSESLNALIDGHDLQSDRMFEGLSGLTDKQDIDFGHNPESKPPILPSLLETLQSDDAPLSSLPPLTTNSGPSSAPLSDQFNYLSELTPQPQFYDTVADDTASLSGSQAQSWRRHHLEPSSSDVDPGPSRKRRKPLTATPRVQRAPKGAEIMLVAGPSSIADDALAGRSMHSTTPLMTMNTMAPATSSSNSDEIEVIEDLIRTTSPESGPSTVAATSIGLAVSSGDHPRAEPPPRSPEPLSCYNCPICFSPPTNATLTPCGHICCGACLFAAVRAGLQRAALVGMGGEGATPRCPVCRAPIPHWDGRGTGVIGLKLRTIQAVL